MVMKKNFLKPFVVSIVTATVMTCCGTKETTSIKDTAVSDAEPELADSAREVETDVDMQSVQEPVSEPDANISGPETVKGDGAVKVEKGANLVKVLKAAEKVTYDYSADSGIWAAVGDVYIVIDEEDLNAKGHKIISGLISDMVSDVALSPDCFDPAATVADIQPL